MPSLLPTVDAQEQRSLDYFRTRTVPELARSFASELWSRFILQTAQHEPAIRHAITALGSLHEYFESADDAHAANSDFGFQQYTRAIRCVLRGPAPFAGQSTDVALISCVLFTAFESLQGHYRSALTHIKSGLKVLAEREANGDLRPGSYVPKELLKSLFTRFDIQALEISDVASRPWLTIEPDTEFKVPTAFSTLEDAEMVLDQYLNILMHFLQSSVVVAMESLPVPDDVLHTLKVRHAHLVRDYQEWCMAFDHYLAQYLTNDTSPSSLLPRQPHPGVLILQIWRIVTRIMLRVALSIGELAFDSFVEESRSVLELAELFMEQTAAPSRTPKWLNGASLTRLESHSSPAGVTQAGPPCIPAHIADNCAKSNRSAKTHAYLRPTCTNGTETSTPEPTSTTQPCSIAPRPPTILKPTFSLSLGLISPLYVTVSRCRDPAIRRRALRLLHSCNRKEGIWDSRLAARVAQRIVEVEEAGAIPLPGQGSSAGSETVVVVSASQIPEHARIRELEVSFLFDRQGSIRYKKSTVGGISKSDSSEYYEEILKW